MPSHSEQQVLPYSAQQLFDLVVDIDKYPEFLPWCRAARILERKENEFLGELVISFAHMTERYTSRVVLNPSNAIDVTMIKGPFEHLINRWKFTPAGEGTQVDFFIDFKFKSKILDKLMGSMFAKATDKMVGAFSERARQLYGKPHA